MTFRYGAGESLYAEAKNHRDEQQWSPAVYYDRPRCILCYRCTRVCGEGMDVWALGVDSRGASSAIIPNKGDRLDCEQCGMCIDICPVGALTSGSYRYKTRPWEMTHVSTVCTHCADGCKVTLGVRQFAEGAEIIRADNRDKSGINNDFLCAKGRFGFDFVHSAERLTQPLIRNEGNLEPATWEQAIRFAAEKLKAIRDSRGGSGVGVIGSNRSTNEENYLLQKFARTILQTNNIDHERTADYPAFARALAGNADRTARMRDVASAPAILLIGGNPTEEHPLLAWRVRSAARLSRARLYIANHRPIKLDRQAKATLQIPAGAYGDLAALLASGQSDFAKAVAQEESLLVLIGSELSGKALEDLVSWGLTRGPNPNSVRFALLGGYVNSRGAADMGLLPDLLPGYVPVSAPGAFAEYAGLPAQPGKTLPQMLDSASGSLAALLVFGADPFSRPGFDPENLKDAFLIVSDLFLTATAARADVVFPAASLYECSGTVTNTYGDLQMLRKAADVAGVKPGFEIIVRLAEAIGADLKSLVPFGKSAVTADLGQSRGAEAGEADQHDVWLAAQGLEPRLSPFDPLAALDEIARLVPGYSIDRLNLFGGNDVHVTPTSEFVPLASLAGPELITPAHDTLFTSGTLGRYSHALQELQQHQAHEQHQTKEITGKANRT
jgi:NADH-quinone oxidoreductase subunit G